MSEQLQPDLPVDPLEPTHVPKVLTAQEESQAKKLEERKQKAADREKQQAAERRELFYKTEIASLTPQVALMKLRKEYAQYTLEHYKYSIELNGIQNGHKNEAPEQTSFTSDSPESFNVVVTQEDLDNNPDMKAAGVVVGQDITINVKDIVKPENNTDGTGND